MDFARGLAKTNISAFLDAKVDAIVLNSAGCGASLVEYGHWFAGRPEADEAERFSEKVVDVSAFFDREGLEPRGGSLPQGTRVTYDAPCHLHHAQGCQKPPLDLLARVPGIDLVPLPGAEHCCGAAGIYNLTHPEMSTSILEEKLDALESTKASVLLSGNPGCIMQWRKGISERGLDVRVMHPVELL